MSIPTAISSAEGRPSRKIHKSLGQEDVILYNALPETSLRPRRRPQPQLIHAVFRWSWQSRPSPAAPST